MLGTRWTLWLDLPLVSFSVRYGHRSARPLLAFAWSPILRFNSVPRSFEAVPGSVYVGTRAIGHQCLLPTRYLPSSICTRRARIVRSLPNHAFNDLLCKLQSRGPFRSQKIKRRVWCTFFPFWACYCAIIRQRVRGRERKVMAVMQSPAG